MSLIFYDIISNLPNKAIAPNTWKARLALNYYGVPYKTEWVEWKDVDSHCKKLGITPTKTWPDGRPYYTLPAIYDPTADIYVSDSLEIARYIEKTYTKSERTLFPGNTIVLQGLVEDALRNTSLKHMTRLINTDVIHHLDKSRDYWVRSREEIYGVPYDQIAPQGREGEVAWAETEAGWGKIDDLFSKSAGPFILGDEPSWGDFVIGAWLIFARLVWGQDGEKWKRVASWHNGRWEKLLDDLKEYQRVD